jgi:hypothetical protein
LVQGILWGREDKARWQPENLKSVLFHDAVAVCVNAVLMGRIVVASIDFDDELAAGAIEIDDPAEDDDLSAELDIPWSGLQKIPENFLGAGGRLTHLSREGELGGVFWGVSGVKRLGCFAFWGSCPFT